MRYETKERWKELAERVIVEEDSDRFMATVQQLLQELDDKEEQRRITRLN